MAHLVRKLLQHGLMPWLTGVVVAALVIGCGGGTDTASNGVGVGGTGAAATGPVTGYGSLIVNNIHFDFSNARFTTEEAGDSNGGDQGDETLPSASLARPVGFGTMVNITSGDVVRQSSGDDRADASLITLVSAIKGPISAKDVSAGTLTVLGQTVKVDSSTQFSGRDLNALSVNDSVVVYGNQDSSTGNYLATRVEYRPRGLMAYKLRGYITGTTKVGAATTELSFGNYVVALPQNARSQTWTVGQLVRVRMLAGTPHLAIVAVPVGAKLSDGVRAHQEGLLSIRDSNVFTLDGVPVDFSQASGVPQLRSGGRIEVSGVMRDGVLVVTEVKSEDTEPNFTSKVKVRGQISGLIQNNGAGQFQLNGGTVTFSSSSTDIRFALANGQWVEAEGVTAADDESGVVASKIVLLSASQH